MKKQLVLLCVTSLVFFGCATMKQPARDPATDLKYGKYIGIAVVAGPMQLKSENTVEDIKPGTLPVEVELTGSQTFSGKLRSDQSVIVTLNRKNFVFRVPQSLIAKDGKISVSKESAEQMAHITVDIVKTLLTSVPEEGIASCSYAGHCIGKESLTCPGKQIVENKVDVYNQHLKIKIYNDIGGVADIKTNDVKVVETNLAKFKSNCM
jgi:hypothetical protein